MESFHWLALRRLGRRAELLGSDGSGGSTENILRRRVSAPVGSVGKVMPGHVAVPAVDTGENEVFGQTSFVGRSYVPRNPDANPGDEWRTVATPAVLQSCYNTVVASFGA